MALWGLTLLLATEARADDPPPTGKAAQFPEMDQAAQEWLNAPGSAAFGKWLTTVLERYPDHPEWLAMYADILQGSRLGPTDGWFRKAVAQTRYSWQAVRDRYDRDGDGKVARIEFPGTSSDFASLDRDGDSFITENDLSWPDHALAPSAGFMFYDMADADSDGRVTKEEFDALFSAADRDGRGFVSLDELKSLFNPPTPPAPPAQAQQPQRPRGPSKSTLVRGLFEQEIGAMKPGPALGEAAPDFTLKTVDGSREYRLSEQLGSQPVVLVFGNITCGPFRSQAGNVHKVYERYKDRAKFLMVYVREAHPSDGWHMAFNDHYKVTLAQPKTFDERASVAQTCQRKLGFDMPFLVDTIDDAVGGTYSGMPSRLYVIDPQGKVAYKSGRGPFGFKPAEMEQALVWTLADLGVAGPKASTTASADATEAAKAQPEPAAAPAATPAPAKDDEPRFPQADNAAAWEMLPVAKQGVDRAPTLPVWARTLARSLPRTAAAMLVLDYRHRVQSPLDPALRAKMRWMAADANRCEYTRRYAESDMTRAGMTDEQIRVFVRDDSSGARDDERAALEFARQLTIDASQVTDEDVARLIAAYGPDKVVAMVQLTAYANFQDRLIHALGLKVEDGGPLPTIEVALDANAVVNLATRIPPAGAAPAVPERIDDPEWTSLADGQIRELLSNQQKRAGRIRVPSWDEVLAKLPPGASHPAKPVRIQWSLVCMGYQPMLGAAWSACTRGFALDSQQDRVFEESLFWVVTRTIHCFY